MRFFIRNDLKYNDTWFDPKKLCYEKQKNPAKAVTSTDPAGIN